jgi:hypothetical protein
MAHHPRAEVVAGVEEAPPPVVVEVWALPSRDHPRVVPWIPLFERAEVGKEVPDMPLGDLARRHPVRIDGVQAFLRGPK